MILRKLLCITFLLFAFNLSGQITFDSSEQVVEYLEGEWQLKKVHGGWSGSTYFPNDSQDYRFVFEIIPESDNTIDCKLLLNDEIQKTGAITVIYNEDLYWGLQDFPIIGTAEFFDYYFYELDLHQDSFALHDASFDGLTMNIHRVSSTSVVEEPKAEIGVKVYPNPTSDFVYLESSENEGIEKIRVLDIQGRVILEEVKILDNRIILPDSQGLYFLEVLLRNGQTEVMKICKE